jgi:hypothetical protein
MSSSTSSSDAFAPGDVAAWRRFSQIAVGLAIGASLALLAAFVALDPYDTGVLALARKQGTTETGGRIGDASRIHDEAFDSAIFGNSHIMTVVPQRLSAATGHRFAMLAIEGTGVPEQMAMLDAYLRRHSPPKALVISVDWVYCLADPRVTPAVYFPYWLYTADRWRYVAGLFQAHTLEVAGRRILHLLGMGPPAKVRDGAVDIFKGVPHTPQQAAATIRANAREDFSREAAMPAFAMLAQRLDRIPRDTKVVLVMPPVVAAILPEPGTPGAAALEACKRRAVALADGRPNVRVLDWHKSTPETEDWTNFWDPSHYYDGLARRVEGDIEAAFGTIAAGR